MVQFKTCKYCKKKYIPVFINGINKRQKYCSKKGKNNSSYIDGRTKKKRYCIDCKRELSLSKYVRCQNCSNKIIGHNNKDKIHHGKWGKYRGIMMRSSWEIIYAKYLDKLKIKWLYESTIFDLGNTTYTPDFYLPERNRYIEIKGYWREDAKKKFKLFKKLYPKVKINLIIKPDIKRIRINLNKGEK